jgi:membrane protein DedA with SNARE-associated domain
VIAGLSSSITSHVASQGVYAVFALMAIDAVFPAASELVMLYGGAVAAGVFGSANHISVLGAHLGFGLGAYVVIALAGTLGYLVGALIGWAIGRYGGRPLLERRGRWVHLSHDKLQRAERWFDRWDDLAVLVGRVTPVIRSFISIPAGVFEMPFGRYVVLTAIGSAIWAFAFAGIGWAAGTSYERFHHDFGYIEYLVVLAVLLLLVFWIYRRIRTSRLAGRASDPPG